MFLSANKILQISVVFLIAALVWNYPVNSRQSARLPAPVIPAEFETRLTLPRTAAAENEQAILQAITDQAQLFYKYLYV